MKMYKIETRKFPSENGRIIWTVLAEMTDRNEAMEYTVQRRKIDNIAARCVEYCLETNKSRGVPIHTHSQKWAHIA
jgi:hypothetical protein